jgi:hypothetical protein
MLKPRPQAFDGAPSANMYGCDLRAEYFELGYELFRDAGTFGATFLAADVFSDDSPLTATLAGKMDMVYTGSFFHLFDHTQQAQVAKRVVQLLAPRAGSLLVGRQVGNVRAGEYVVKGRKGDYSRYRHDAESWRAMWAKVGVETGTRWEVGATMEEWGDWRGSVTQGWITGRRKDGDGGEADGRKDEEGEGARKLGFLVRRL